LLSLAIALAWEARVPPVVKGQGAGWSEPVNISNTLSRSWFPALAVDWAGNVHVVWCETDFSEEGRGESVYYTRWDGQRWLEPNDIAPPSGYIHRNAIALGQAGTLFLAWRDWRMGGYGLNIASASASDAWSAAAWSSPRLVSARLHNYAVHLETDSQEKLHLLFGDMGHPDDEVCPHGCLDTYYRHSADNGKTWSAPLNLSLSPTGSAREQLEIDRNDTIHVTWDEGYDRLSGLGTHLYSVYRSSSDGGLSWTAPVTVAYPTTGTAQLVAGADGQGSVMLVWRTTSHEGIYFQWSADHADTWSAPASLPGVLARPGGMQFDLYDLSADSAGHIHLLAAGRQSPEYDAPVGLYHVIWNGESWSEPVPIYVGEGFPEYPRLKVAEGNHLHAVWFVRDELWTSDSNYEVWYSDCYSPAPHETPVPPPTQISVPTAQRTAARPLPSATPFPTIAPGTAGLPAGLRTETDEVLRLAVALAPVVLILLLAAVFRALRRRTRM